MISLRTRPMPSQISGSSRSSSSDVDTTGVPVRSMPRGSEMSIAWNRSRGPEGRSRSSSIESRCWRSASTDSMPAGRTTSNTSSRLRPEKSSVRHSHDGPIRRTTRSSSTRTPKGATRSRSPSSRRTPTATSRGSRGRRRTADPRPHRRPARPWPACRTGRRGPRGARRRTARVPRARTCSAPRTSRCRRPPQ